MLPLTLLRTAVGHIILVELKNGETYNGTLVSHDNYMNLNLKDVVCTSRDGDRHREIKFIYIRGVTIKYFCITQEVLANVQEEVDDFKDQEEESRRGRGNRGRGRGGRGGRGRGNKNRRGGRGGKNY
eukprot:TRINITY_DN1071_c0_g1_i2.p1 TRINITY_DN1071_c0_g1~~TRINITY_DN1071_c0_g1_i2.p1  ORF type:complete len:138 (+),score=27.67 TRINITY_DN1071_c0_g1_i2:34-414(+)